MGSLRQKQAWIAFAVLSVPVAGVAQTIPAFSGADGAAANVSGGRGGIVYHVTKLDSAIDDPERNDFGTLRYGLTASNFPANTPRTIVFDVGGVFHLGRLDQPNAANGPWVTNGNGWDAQSRLTIGGSNVTLAGQTAPGKGVIFMGGGLKPQGNNNIIRNVTVASGYGMTSWWSPGNAMRASPGTPEAGTDASQWYPDNVVYDAMDIAGTNLMIDHVSLLYATDETLSMNEVANNISVQYSNISQGQNYPQWDAEGGGLTGHALGSLLSAGNTTSQAAISFHHNLYAHQKGRVPQLGTISGSQSAYYDFRNNVFYNWLGTAGSKSGATFLNLVNNFYLAGDGGDNPVGGSTAGWTNASGGTGVISASSTLHRLGNVLDSNKDADANDGTVLTNGTAANPFWMNGVVNYNGVTDSATTAFTRVLNYMGANWWTRDGVIDTPDERIINEALTGTGKIMAWADDPWNTNSSEGTEWRSLLNTVPVSRPANWDTDQDGMPDTWEAKHGLNPNVENNNADFDTDGYTDLEEYLNELAEWPAPEAIVFDATTNSRYAQITNWDANSNASLKQSWQPSKYDTAEIRSGTVTVDAVGQHAGTLKVGTTGTAATLSVASGWIEVATLTQIGATGSLQIAAPGTLVTQSITSSTLATNHGLLMINAGGTLNGITGTGVLTLASGSLNAGAVTQGGVAVNAGATLTATAFNTTVNSANDGTLTTSANGNIAGLTGIGTTNVTGGTLTTTGAIRQNALNVSNGAVARVAANGAILSKVGTLNVNSTGTLDLNDNDLVVVAGAGTYASVNAKLGQGYNSGDWSGTGIRSTSAAGAGNTALGILTGQQFLDNDTLGAGTFSGHTVAANDLLVKYTYQGDNNLDGAVDDADLFLFLPNYTGSQVGDWLAGDYTYDGAIDDADLFLFLPNYTGGASGLNAAMSTLGIEPTPAILAAESSGLIGSALVPEPANLSLLALGAGSLLRRRVKSA